MDKFSRIERAWRRRGLVIVFLLIVLLMIFSTSSFGGQPIYQAQEGDLTLSLYSTPCKLDAVRNLPNRALWKDKDGSHEGCYGLDRALGVVVCYFSDRTAVVLPAAVFKKVHSA